MTTIEDLEQKLREALSLPDGAQLERSLVSAPPATEVAQGDAALAFAPETLARELTQQPRFSPESLPGDLSDVGLYRWGPDPRVLLLDTRQAPTQTSGAVTAVQDLGLALAPVRDGLSVVRVRLGGQDVIVANDQGHALVSVLHSDSTERPDIAALLEGWTPEEWLSDLIHQFRSLEGEWTDAVAVGLISRLAASTDARGSNAAIDDLLAGRPSPAKRCAGWANATSAEWRRAREQEVIAESVRLQGSLDSLSRLAHEDGDSASLLATTLRENREAIAAVMVVLSACGSDDVLDAIVDGVDEVARNMAGTLAWRVALTKSALLDAVQASHPDDWWGASADE